MAISPTNLVTESYVRPSAGVGTFDDGRPNPKISIAFDRDTFNRISKAARKRGVSFASVVREACARELENGR